METRPQWHVAFLSPKWGETVLFEVGSCLRGDPAWGPPNSEGRGQSCLWLSRSLFLWSLNTQGWTEGPGPGRGPHNVTRPGLLPTASSASVMILWQFSTEVVTMVRLCRE